MRKRRLVHTRDGSFKKVVRRHAQETGQRYTEALSDLEGVDARLAWRRWAADGRSESLHEPIAERLLAHLRGRYGTDAVAKTKLGQHNDHVFRIDRRGGDPWIARVFPPARPRAGVEGDAAILRSLERQDYPAERLAVDDATSAFDASSVLVTRFILGGLLARAVGPEDIEKFTIMGDLLDGCTRCHSTSPPPAPVGRAVRILAVRAAQAKICWQPSRSSMLSTRRCRRPTASRSSSSAPGCARG